MQATRDDWEQVIRHCCHLLPEPPGLTAGLEHFIHTIDENGLQLPSQFFDASDPKHYHWSLGCIRAWIDQGAFVHSSGSYMGGPYGFKWLVLLFVHLHSGSSKIELGLGPSYRNVVPEWTNKDRVALAAAVGQVQESLNRSVVVLMRTMEQRKRAAKDNGSEETCSMEWAQEDVTVSVAQQATDEWTRRNLMVTAGTRED
ncbi:hypothetical protein FRC08_009608 [Ceratobasidium sp. 394]|nr:hypothetical protein FRC08_009608 [Ceratobasidium sp. 394]